MRRREAIKRIAASAMALPFYRSSISRHLGGTTCPTGVGACGFRFFDDFAGSSLSSDWTVLNRVGDLSNSELQYYLPANVSVASSILSINSKVQSFGGQAYTSAMVQWTSFNFLYGTIQVSAKMGGGQGPWPAIWLLGQGCEATNPITADNGGTCQWADPGSQEIDIAEFKSSQYTHCGQNLITSVLDDAGDSGSFGFDATAAFHVYELDWTPSSLVWKVDGRVTRTVTANVPNTSMFLIMNCAMGGSGGSVSNGTLPVINQFDFVRVI